jgi:hypothetical protein
MKTLSLLNFHFFQEFFLKTLPNEKLMRDYPIKKEKKKKEREREWVDDANKSFPNFKI